MLAALPLVNQLGARKKDDLDRPADSFPTDAKKLLATVLGALLFSFNIAPTVEPHIIATSTSWWHTIALAGFSLLVSYVMITFAAFAIRGEQSGLLRDPLTETVISYAAALAISAALLWIFGYLSTATAPPLALKWTIVMGYVTTLGGSAGRLIL